MPNVKMSKNILLAPYTTFKIGGAVKCFCETRDSEEIIAVITMAKKKNLPFFILGGGSNVLVSDKGFDGLVIRIQNPKSKIQNSTIYADAGVLLSNLVADSIKTGLTGLEWAAGIPGTIGGAIRGNAGAFSGSMAEIVKTIKVFDVKSQKIKTLKNTDFKFGYRDSIFKKNKNLIILSVELELKKGDKEKSKKLIKEYLRKRQATQPLEFMSAGCIFKNPVGQSAGYLIEQCGLKGKKINGAMISEKHANFIINAGGAKAKDVINLINLCKEKVKEKFGIELQEEIEYVGDF